MGYPGRHNIYRMTIRRMVLQALEEQEQEFQKLHEKDTDQQLLDYIKLNARRLRHTPWPGEVIGGHYIEERFGSWRRVLALAQLPPPVTANQQKYFTRFQEETERQKEKYRLRKAEKKILAQQRLVRQSARKRRPQSDQEDV